MAALPISISPPHHQPPHLLPTPPPPPSLHLHPHNHLKSLRIPPLPSPSATAAAAVSAASTSGGISFDAYMSPSLIKERCKSLLWRGYRINYLAVEGEGRPVLLVHEFGASIGHWRRNIGVLAENNSVYALDLLGFGASDKPEGFAYTMEVWSQIIKGPADDGGALDAFVSIVTGPPGPNPVSLMPKILPAAPPTAPPPVPPAACEEITLLSQFEHENIVQYLGTDKNRLKKWRETTYSDRISNLASSWASDFVGTSLLRYAPHNNSGNNGTFEENLDKSEAYGDSD
ncbi:hypothetical protein QJS10_CPA08g00983 [Acorus calamus]|uniref:AB hydrolase-1 domain-containing protein n=1 Tax=Acorus calamus TaxID=4465 RepID=A0AAV9EBS5_ACOCL|nr:hypothetical protein QJS10_CPA08g00983 [Acorus calamus]